MNKRYVFFTLFSILLVGLISTGLSNGVYALPSITLSPTSGTPGSTVTVTGSSFSPNSSIDILFDGEKMRTVIVSSSGSFTTTFTIPTSKAPGDYNVIATDYAGNTAPATFTVTTLAEITLSPTGGQAGTTVAVSGTKFAANTRITIKFDSNTVTTNPSTITSSSSGSFSATFTVPSSASLGSHTITVTDGTNTVSATFNVGAAITLSPTSGAAGTTITVLGSGFGANRQITIKFDSNTVTTNPSTITTSSSGTFSASFAIPAGTTTGSHTVSATEGTKTASATFTVSLTPTITLSPNSGAPSITVTITGTGFTANSAITVKFDSTTLATTPASVTTSSTGAFSATITIPNNATTGSHTISATDASGKTGSAAFNITTSGTITLSPTGGIAGSTATISGSSFSSSSTVTIKFDGATLVTSPATITASTSGNFSATITIPTNSSVGSHTITVTDASGRTASAAFNVTTAGTITIAPTTGPSGTELTITGSNFAPNKKVIIKFGDTSVRTFPLDVVTSTSGTFVAKFDVPAGITGGSYTISATDETGRLGIATFTVLGQGASISLSPASGKAGTTVTVTGSGFASNVAITIKSDGNIVATNPATVTTTSTGAFTATITIPTTASAGNHMITASSNLNTATANFNVVTQTSQSSIMLSPTSVTPGSSVTVSGSSFTPNIGITVKLDNNIIATSITTSAGSFTITFNTPATITAGSHTVSASDGTNSASAMISITGGTQEMMGLSNLKIVDPMGLSISRVSAGMQILIQSDLKNNQSTDQKFVYIVQVKDSEGAVIMVSWMSGTLPAGKQYAVAQSWLVEEKGRYEIEIFTWESISNPAVLAPSLKSTINVS